MAVIISKNVFMNNELISACNINVSMATVAVHHLQLNIKATSSQTLEK